VSDDMSTAGRVLSLLHRLVKGEALTVQDLVLEGWSDPTARRDLACLQQHVPSVVRHSGRPARWTYEGDRAQFRFCPWCGKALP